MFAKLCQMGFYIAVLFITDLASADVPRKATFKMGMSVLHSMAQITFKMGMSVLYSMAQMNMDRSLRGVNLSLTLSPSLFCLSFSLKC